MRMDALWLIALFIVFDNCFAFYSQREADLVTSKYIKPSIVLEFEDSNFGKSKDLYINDLIKHHDLVRKFCKSRAKISKKKKRGKRVGSCSWRD